MNSQLKNFLSAHPPGVIQDSKVIDQLMADEWPSLSGSDDGGMQACKLLGRTEQMAWQPPHLTFSIERHGATVNGSTRAEMQVWQVDVSTWTAQIVSVRRRQLHRTSARLDVTGDAARVADDILNDRESPSLKRYSDGRVKVLIGTIIPDDGFKQTIAGRRKRFRKSLEGILIDQGWIPIGTNTYMQKPPPNRAMSSLQRTVTWPIQSGRGAVSCFFRR